MEMAGPTPRVNFTYMEQYLNTGKTVLLLVKMQTVEAGQAHATTSDGAQVIIHLKQPAVETEYVEFAGTVEAPNQLRETDRAYFGGKFDMGTYEELVKFANTQYSSYFK